ncbi:secretin N-terminal domain-containing protein [Brevundimonas staleyi]|uniref:Secretin N-terminal domain-containing protein n=1 Tax=Brevundimonas staleyi TaxID=74326 RepID=A0ABW0FS52_9CAUL
MSDHARSLKLAVCLLPLVLVAGCAATFPTLTTSVSQADPTGIPAEADQETASTDNAPTQGRRDTLRIPSNVGARPEGRPPVTDAQIDALVSDEMVDTTLAPQPMGQFIATVFGGVLQLPYTVSPDVASRQEVIAGGTGGTVSKRTLFRLTQRALAQYGIQVYADGNYITIGSPDAAPGGGQVIRGRDPQPNASRVVQFFTVQSIDISALQPLLADLYPQLSGVRVTPDSASNSLILSGSGRDVAALARALREIDQPRFAGADVLRVEPVFLNAEALSQALNQALSTEGYVVSTQIGITRAITILTFPAANQILVFSENPDLLDRARFWVDTLDQPAALGAQQTTFVYQVRNTDAQSLGQLAMGQAPTTSAIQPPVGVPGGVAQQSNPLAGMTGGAASSTTAAATSQNNRGVGSTSGQFLGGRLITDPTGNRILFTGTASDYAQLRTLLQTLDVPAPQVVIEVMIAEVTLTDGTDIGVELFGRATRGDGVWSGGTEGLNIGGDGLLATFVGPDFRAAINASASNNKVNILQRPQLVTRSGGSARFQVGTDVPILASQRATNTAIGGGGTDVLQNIQYRQTGVILDLKPTVYGDRVDIQISQEISSAGAAPAGIASPTILNRSLTTQISIADGLTGVLGGLVSNNYSKSNVGIPFLKDIPLLGSAFQTNSVDGDRTELLILITPRIIRNDDDMADLANSYSRDMNAAFRTGRGWSYTLTPFSAGPGVRGIGFDLPSAERASERPPFLPRLGPRAGQTDVDTALPVATEPAPVVVVGDAPAPPVVVVTPPQP